MLIAALLAALSCGVAVAQADEWGNEKTTAQAKKENCNDARQAISYYRSTTWKWQKMYQEHRKISPTKASSRQIAMVESCAYVRWVAKLWQNRSLKARHALESWVKSRRISMTWDWPTAVQRVQVVFPGTAAWQMSCSDGEGGWGRFVMNTQGSPAGGWMQFYASTYYAFENSAREYVKRKGFVVHPSAWSWKHPLGQALVSGYIRHVLGISTSYVHWSPAIDYKCR